MGDELIGRDGRRYFRVPFIIIVFVPGKWRESWIQRRE